MSEWNDDLIAYAVNHGATLEVAEAFMSMVQTLHKEKDARSWDEILSDVERAAYAGLGE